MRLFANLMFTIYAITGCAQLLHNPTINADHSVTMMVLCVIVAKLYDRER